MARFFFDLQGGRNTHDPGGLPFESELDAFRAAQKLAEELSRAQPNLRGNTCVVVIRNDGDNAFYVSVERPATAIDSSELISKPSPHRLAYRKAWR
jgi:uncharacterized protein DUF6894